VFRHVQKLHKKKIYHGDLKPENILIGDTVYILDVGSLRKDVSPLKKRAYDLASLMCCFLTYQPVEEIVRIARSHYPRKDFHAVSEYVELIQLRPDFHFNDEMKHSLLSQLPR
jgi:tRNA A-37 threonylcarbamoyl transferase component Bud32